MEAEPASQYQPSTFLQRLKRLLTGMMIFGMIAFALYEIGSQYLQIDAAEEAACNSVPEAYRANQEFLKLNPDFDSIKWTSTEDIGCALTGRSCIDVVQTLNVMTDGQVRQLTCEWTVTLQAYAAGNFPWDTQKVIDVEATNTEARELFDRIEPFPYRRSASQ